MEYQDEVIGVHLTAAFRLSQLAGGHMWHCFVAVVPRKHFVPAYAAAKGGIARLTRALANEWACKGIDVNASAPGYMVTDSREALRNDPQRNRQIPERIRTNQRA